MRLGDESHSMRLGDESHSGLVTAWIDESLFPPSECLGVTIPHAHYWTRNTLPGMDLYMGVITMSMRYARG